jgi:hypothetical protein
LSLRCTPPIDEKVVVDPETYHYEPDLIKQVSRKSRSLAVEYGKKKEDAGLSTMFGNRGRNTSGIRPGPRRASNDSQRAHAEISPVLSTESDDDEELSDIPATSGKNHSLNDLEEEKYIICTHEIMGYILKGREWGKF